MATDCEVYRKNDRDLGIAVKDPSGVDVDVTGWDAEFTLVSNTIAAEPLVHLETPGDVARLALSADGCVVTLLAADLDVEPGWYAWDLRLVDTDAKAFTPIKGYLRVLDALSLG